MNNVFCNLLRGKTAIIGIGNIMKADDGFGPVLVKRLENRVKALCIDAGTVPENYIGKIAKYDPRTILLVDAVNLNAPSGQYEILKAQDIIKSGFTTHDISPRMFMDYLSERTKADIYMLGLQPLSVTLGSEMSDNVKKAVGELTVMIEKVLNA